MTLQQLSYLIKVAECGNITEAAEQLYISQPSLSTAISNLEKEMGVTAFIRTKKGVIVTHEGEELLSFARMLLEQADIMKEHFGVVNKRDPKFSVLSKLLKKNDLVYEQLIEAKPHVFICKRHPLADMDFVTIEDLKQYPYLVFEQGERNSFYFSEEFLSVLDFPKNIQVRDRATLFNLAIGLNGFTVSSGIIDEKLNGSDIIAKPLKSDCIMRIGLVRKKNIMLSRYAEFYIKALKNNLSIV